jgi:hypothetical protein
MARIAELLASPPVAAILTRAATLTDTERAKLNAVGVEQFNRHRQEQTKLHHRVTKAAPDRWRDFGMVQERAWRAVTTWDKASHTPDPHPFAAHAVADVVWATVAREYLSDEEFRLFARPWLDVIGQ